MTALDQLFQRSVVTLVTIYIVVGASVLIAIAFGVFAFLQRYRKYRGKRTIMCPETRHCEAVELDAPLAAMSSLLDGPELHLTSCTGWPERQDCAQGCIREIHASPYGCRVRALLDNWYNGKQCIYCQRTFAEIHWLDHKPALQSPEGKIVEWEAISPQAIPATLDTHQPVCWDCKVVENFRAEHAELVTSRPWRHY
jgi:hypothetical protein